MTNSAAKSAHPVVTLGMYDASGTKLRDLVITKIVPATRPGWYTLYLAPYSGGPINGCQACEPDEFLDRECPGWRDLLVAREPEPEKKPGPDYTGAAAAMQHVIDGAGVLEAARVGYEVALRTRDVGDLAKRKLLELEQAQDELDKALSDLKRVRQDLIAGGKSDEL